jgi:hypothetical protein
VHFSKRQRGLPLNRRSFNASFQFTINFLKEMITWGSGANLCCSAFSFGSLPFCQLRRTLGLLLMEGQGDKMGKGLVLGNRDMNIYITAS